MYFLVYMLHGWRKRSAVQPQMIDSEFPWPKIYPQGLWNVETEPVEQNEQKFSFTGAVEKMRNLHTRAVEKKSLQA